MDIKLLSPSCWTDYELIDSGGVPVNTVQVKEPYILIIISKGIFLTAVTYGFTKSFVSDDLCVAVV